MYLLELKIEYCISVQDLYKSRDSATYNNHKNIIADLKVFTDTTIFNLARFLITELYCKFCICIRSIYFVRLPFCKQILVSEYRWWGEVCVICSCGCVKEISIFVLPKLVEVRWPVIPDLFSHVCIKFSLSVYSFIFIYLRKKTDHVFYSILSSLKSWCTQS